MKDLTGYTVLVCATLSALYFLKLLLFPAANKQEETDGNVDKETVKIANIAMSWGANAPQSPVPVAQYQPMQALHSSATSPAETVEQLPVSDTESPGMDNYGVFLNPEIQDFWNNYSGTAQQPFRDIIQDVLRELDNPGDHDTPSVVRVPNQAKEPDNDFSVEMFDVLKRVPLWRHLINTAKEYIATVVEKDRGTAFYHSAIIACLSHDIGKLKAYLRYYYTTGEHAWQGSKVIERIIGTRLNDMGRGEIVKAVYRHHDRRLKEVDSLTALLMHADRRARENESRGGSAQGTHPVDQIPAENLDERDLRVPWFVPAEFLLVLEKYINVYTNKNTFAFSMRRGYVFFTPNVIFNCFHELAKSKDAPESNIYDSSKPDYLDRKQLHIFIAGEMYKHGYMADDLIKPGFYTAPFLVHGKSSQKPAKVRLAPYRADVFKNINLAVIEKKKNKELLAIESVEKDKGVEQETGGEEQPE